MIGLLVVVVACFVAAALAPIVCAWGAGRRWLGTGAGCFAAGCGSWFAAQAPAVTSGRTPELVLSWVPLLGIDLALRLDGLGLLFALLVTWIGAAIFVYAGAYLGDHAQAGRFFAYLLSFMGAMLGVVLADDLVTLYVFYELTTVSSFLLIAFEHEQEAARRAAKQAFLVTTAGGLCLLAAVLLIQQTTGTLRLSALAAHAGALRAGPYLAVLLLVVAAAFTKSAQVPLQSWLPNAMAAPTPVSAYLHSAAMVKVGVFVLARLAPALGSTPAWTGVLGLVGGVTAVTGAWLALRDTDLKRVLAYATVSALGLLTLLLGVGGEAGTKAFLTYLVAHALYKSALFMVAGALDHAAGTRDLRALGGLGRVTPALAAVAGLAAWSFAGAPPSLGFVGKELLYGATLDVGGVAAAAAVLASIGVTAAAGLAAVRPFLRHDGAAVAAQARAEEHPPALALWAAPAVCALAGVGLGLAPGLLDPLLGAAAGSVLARPVSVHLAAWHGVGLELGLSALTLLTGVGAYLAWARLRDGRPLAALDAALGRGPDRAYDAIVAGMLRVADWQTRRLQTGNVRDYVAAILAALVGTGGAALLRAHELDWPARDPPPARDWLILALLLAAAGIACRAPVRFRTVIALSVAGYAAALLYQTYGAPDLALVQVLVETLVVILFILALGGMPVSRRETRPRAERLRDVVLAVGAGGVVVAAMLLVLSAPFEPRLGLWYGLNAHELARGRNVVNVILVDFRAFDTLGEVIVLVVASLGVWVLLEAETPPGDRPEAAT